MGLFYMKYENFIKAMANLKSALPAEPPYSPLEQTGFVGLFSIVFELAWKLMKEVLEFHGAIPNKIASPRTVLKLAYQNNMIKDEKLWLEILNTRNLLTHIYSDIDSSATIENIKHKYYDAFNDLKREIDENWRE